MNTTYWKIFFIFYILCSYPKICLSKPFSSYAKAFYVGPDIHIQPKRMMSRGQSFHGYVAYRFDVANNSSSQHHNLLIMIKGHDSRKYHIREIRRTIRLGPNEKASISLMQPPVNLNGQLIVRVDQGQWKKTIHLPHAYRFDYDSSRKKNIRLLISQQSRHFLRTINKVKSIKKKKKKYIKPTSSFDFSLSPIPCQAWSKQWLAYTRFDGIVLSAKEINALPQPIYSAVISHVELGGSLLVIGDWNAPKHWQSDTISILQATSFSPHRSQNDPFRQGSFSTTFPSPSPQIFYPGFGQSIVLPKSNAKTIDAATYKSILQMWSHSLKPWRKQYSTRTANNQFPVVKDLSIPTRGIFIMMLIFSLLVGPINTFLLTRKKKRILILVTVPILSIITCLCIISYALYSEGWNGYTRSQSIVILNQKQQTATSIGWLAYYLPITSQEGLAFEDTTEVTPLWRTNWRSPGRGVSLNWDHGQHLTKGWLMPRVPIHFAFRKREQRRERILPSYPGPKKANVLNGIGVRIKQIYLADHTGNVFFGRDIPAGEKSTLTLEPSRHPQGSIDSLRSLYQSTWNFHAKQISSMTMHYLKPNTYIAWVDPPLFLENAQATKSNRSSTIIFGILKGGNRESRSN